MSKDLFYQLPEFSSTSQVIQHAMDTALNLVKENKPTHAAVGGPMLFSGTDGCQWLKEQGVDTIQIAGCDVSSNQNLWQKVFNAIMDKEFPVEMSEVHWAYRYDSTF